MLSTLCTLLNVNSSTDFVGSAALHSDYKSIFSIQFISRPVIIWKYEDVIQCKAMWRMGCVHGSRLIASFPAPAEPQSYLMRYFVGTPSSLPIRREPDNSHTLSRYCICTRNKTLSLTTESGDVYIQLQKSFRCRIHYFVREILINLK